MSQIANTEQWKALASAARKEQDPRKFVYLLKELYDMVNYAQVTSDHRSASDLRRDKETRTGHAPKAA